MDLLHYLVVLLTFTGIQMPYPSNAQTMGSTSEASRLDTLLQDYAFRALVRPSTGVIYSPEVPMNFSGVTLSVVRLRSGSFRSRGLKNFREFDIPVGIIATPYVVRLALVYQNLGNWSSVYYNVPGYTFLTPVIGLLAYSAANLSATNLPVLDFIVSSDPMSIRFKSISLLSTELAPKCVHFHLNGSYQLGDLVSSDICTAYGQGHFSVVMNSTALAPSPAPSQGPPSPIPEHAKEGDKTIVWKIVVGVVGGALALVLLLLLFWLLRYRRSRKMKEMVKHSETGEVLTTYKIGNAQLPVATMVRTRPVLESEYAP